MESVGGVLCVIFCTESRIVRGDMAVFSLIKALLGEVKIFHVITKCDTTTLIEKKSGWNI